MLSWRSHQFIVYLYLNVQNFQFESSCFFPLGCNCKFVKVFSTVILQHFLPILMSLVSSKFRIFHNLGHRALSPVRANLTKYTAISKHYIFRFHVFKVAMEISLQPQMKISWIMYVLCRVLEILKTISHSSQKTPQVKCEILNLLIIYSNKPVPALHRRLQPQFSCGLCFQMIWFLKLAPSNLPLLVILVMIVNVVAQQVSYTTTCGL